MTAAEFRAMRDAKNYSQAQIAGVLHVVARTIRSWERRGVPERPRAGLRASMADKVRALPPNPRSRKLAGNPNWKKGVKRKMSKSKPATT
jgi:transcriptional regulator with XRE-family HTH domain